MLGAFGDESPSCRCDLRIDDHRLRVDSDAYPGSGDLATAPACRATVVRELAEREIEVVLTSHRSLERAYEREGLALLVAAGRFHARAGFHDRDIARTATRDPIAATEAAANRRSRVSRLATETGLVHATGSGDYEEIFRPFIGPTIAHSRIRLSPERSAELVDWAELDTGATVRIYRRDDGLVYHIDPLEGRFDPETLALLADARDHLVSCGISRKQPPAAAVRAVATRGAPVDALSRVLRKHTQGWGILSDLFADPAVSDVFVSAPADEMSLRVRRDGRSMPTNVRLTDRGTATLASRFRRESGRAFSRADPTIDAATEVAGRRGRAAGVTSPVSDGVSFAFRAHDPTPWTLPALVANETLLPRPAGLCALAVVRGAAVLVTGARGAGKTTLLSALCWELSPSTRTLVVEDTPELPVGQLRADGRDIQRLMVTTDDGPGLGPIRALRSALRLGEGALVVGEVRGEEATHRVWIERVLETTDEHVAGHTPAEASPAEPGPGTPMAVGVNLSADRAYVALLREAELSGVLDGVYAANSRLRSRVQRVSVSRSGRGHLSGWTRVGETIDESNRVTPAQVVSPDAGEGWHTLASYGREVDVRRTIVRRWRRGNRTRTTRLTRTVTYRVGLGVVGRHSTSELAPNRGIATVHESGAGPLGGRNLADVTPRAVDRLIRSRGGVDRLSVRAVTDGVDTGVVRVDGAQPEGLREWVRRDLGRLRERIRNVTVTVDRGDVGTFAVNPPAELSRKLATRRETLIDAPETYGSVAAKARVAARVAYLDRVIARLDQRASRRDARRGRLDGLLTGSGDGSLGVVQDIVRNHTTPVPDGAASDWPWIDAEPPYLSLVAVEGASVDGEPPLVARNHNIFATPHGGAANTVVELFSRRRTDLGTAAAALRSAGNSAPSAELERAINRSVRRLRTRLRTVLRRAGIGRTSNERRAIVTDGLSGWTTPAGRALALANGSAIDPIVHAAEGTMGPFNHTTRAQLEARLRTVLASASASEPIRPPRPPVAETATAVRRSAVGALRAGIESGGREDTDTERRRVLGKRLGSLPAGLPVAPVPGYWYATANFWKVTVKGTYGRFTVRTPRGRPGDLLAYVRDGSPVWVDVTLDGRRERLGRASRIRFETRTWIVVVVPPSGTGVGDTDGTPDERSEGWPDPPLDRAGT